MKTMQRASVDTRQQTRIGGRVHDRRVSTACTVPVVVDVSMVKVASEQDYDRRRAAKRHDVDGFTDGDRR